MNNNIHDWRKSIDTKIESEILLRELNEQRMKLNQY